jgi:hypothetical protein
MMTAPVRTRLWQWRRSELRRRSDVVEGWVALVGAVLIGLGAPLAGWGTGVAVDGALTHASRVQRAHRVLLPAVVERVGRRVRHDDAVVTARPGAELTARVRWNGPDGRTHAARVFVGGHEAVGDTVLLWTDRRTGRPAAPPLDAVTVHTHAVFAGIGVGLGAGMLGVAGRQALLWELMRRRLAEWEREWEAAGQSWGRAGAGG